MNKKGLSIRIKKASGKNRKHSYTFESTVPGKEVTIIVGRDGVTAEWIERLHQDDDCEVKNNIKNAKAPTEEWEMKVKEQWETEHPGVEYPKKWHISMDAVSADDDEENASACAYGDKSMVLAAPTEEVDGEKMSVRDLVATYPMEQQELYRLYYIEEYSKAEIALLLGCSKANITQRISRLEEKIKKYFSQS